MISNTITIFRTLLTIPLFALLAFGGNAWIALALFLGAGALDMVDGKVARARNETSAFGAMIDLLGDRLLTFVTVLGLCIGSELRMYALLGIVLVVRDIVVTTLNEALPGKLEIRVSVLEKFKITAAFLGLSMMMVAQALFQGALAQGAEAPQAPDAGWGLAMFAATSLAIAAVALAIASVLTLATLVEYWRRALRAFRGA